MSRKVVDLYKEAWETHSIDILSSIFHKDIRYQEHCKNIILGINNLNKYWIENSKKQSNVLFSPIKVISNENETVVFWEAQFYDSIKYKSIHLQGIMWLSFKDDKIIELTEFFEHK